MASGDRDAPDATQEQAHRGLVDEMGSAERTVFFTDAVAAIALTLLILPLMEAVSSASESEHTTAELLSEHGGQLFAFLLSFGLITISWLSHHALFTHVDRLPRRMMLLNVLWMLTIVFLPIATAMAGTMDTDRLQIAIYVGTILATNAVMAAMNQLALNNPACWNPHNPPTTDGRTASLSVALICAVAMAIGLIWPVVGYLPMFLLFLVGPLARLLSRRS